MRNVVDNENGTDFEAVNAANTESGTEKTESDVQENQAASQEQTDPASNESQEISIPLMFFNNKEIFDKFSKSVKNKATKAGIRSTHGRTWGPSVTLTPKEGADAFKVANMVYTNKDGAFTKNERATGYVLRKRLSELFGIKIANVRQYNRKPKPEPVSAPVVQEPMEQLAASMPPRARLDHATKTLDMLASVLEDNGQSGIASMLLEVKQDIAVPENN